MRRLLWTAAALLLTAGCAAPGREAATEPDVSAPLPLAGAMYFSAAERTALRKSEESLIRICMRERGHEYRIGPAHDARRAAAVNPYTVLSPQWSRSDGYGLTGEALEGPPEDPNAKMLAALPEAEREDWQKALLGSLDDHMKISLPSGRTVSYDPGSCAQQARDEVYGRNWPELRYTVEDLSNEVIRRTLDSADFREVEKGWARCMADLGHSYASLEDPRKEILDRLARAKGDRDRVLAVGDRELDLAEDDLSCQISTDTHRRIAGVQARAEEPVRAKAGKDLDRFQQAKRTALSRLPGLAAS
ncbi:hypothetical protein ABZ252_24800 [Streptomyces sp. NPDC006175]|uniref:hypothetical protein n=1 Tax=unclassified Streptomyces TaxID=2593676 RepID=UPI0033B7E0A3